MAREILERDLDMAGLAVYGPRAAINPTDLICLRDMPTFTSGLTQDPTTKIVRNDVITGKAGGQTWVGGTAAGDPLAINASSNAAPGTMTLTESQFIVNLIPTPVSSNPASVFDGFKIPTATVAISGSTTIATALGFNLIKIEAPVYNGTATIANASTLTIASSPSGTAPRTNSYALWVQTGITNLAGQVLIQNFTGMLKATGGLVTAAVPTVDYELALTFNNGVTRAGNTITADYITGHALGGSNTTWTGGTGSGEGIILRTTAHATKGKFQIGSMYYDESTLRLGIGKSAPARPLHITDAGDVQLRFGQDVGGLADYELGRKSADGLAYLTSTHPTVSGFVVTGPNGDRFRVASNGAVTILGLVGTGSTLVKTDATGLLARGAAGADFQAPLTAADGTITFPTTSTIKVGTLPQKFIAQGTADTTLSGAQFLGALGTGLLKNTTTTGVLSAAIATVDYEPALTFGTGLFRNVNTITANITTGHAGGQTAFGGTATGESLTLSSTAHATKGFINFGTSTYDETNNRLGVGVGTPTDRLHVVGPVTGISARFTDNVNSTLVISHPSGGQACIFGTVGSTLNLGAGNTTNYLQIATGGGITATNLAGTGSTLTKVSATGLFSRALGGVGGDYEFPLTFGTGLFRNVNNITNNLSTGAAGGQTAFGGTATGQNLTLKSTTTGSGKILFGLSSYDDTADVLTLLSANTTFTTPTLVLASNTTGQAVMHFRTSTSTLRAGLRADSTGSFYHFNGGGVHSFLTGGDFGTGAVRAKIFANGDFLVYGGLAPGVDPADEAALFSVVGTANRGTLWSVAPALFTPTASSSLDLHMWDAVFVSFSGTTHVTTAGGVNYVAFLAPTYSNASSSQIIDSAATVAIYGAPQRTGFLTITNPYGLWVQNSASRFDGGVTIGGVTGSARAALSVTGKTGLDSVLFFTQGGTITDNSNRDFFQISHQGCLVSDGVAASHWYGVSINAPSFARAGSGVAPSVGAATTLRISGEPSFGPTITVSSRYALHLNQGVARFDGGSAVGDSTVVFEFPNVAPPVGLSTAPVAVIPVRLGLNPATFWIPVLSNA